MGAFADCFRRAVICLTLEPPRSRKKSEALVASFLATYVSSRMYLATLTVEPVACPPEV